LCTQKHRDPSALTPQACYCFCRPHQSHYELSIRERIAQLKQEERELRDSYALSQGSLDRAKTLEAKLIAIVEEIAELERALPAKITRPS
jgi:hypothetical protein